jgi:hypothetical protein
MDKLDEIKAALAATTPGTWEDVFDDEHRRTCITTMASMPSDALTALPGDLLFMLAAHNDYVPWLIARVEELERDLLGTQFMGSERQQVQ